MTYHGFVAIDVIQASYDAESFVNWVQTRALPEMMPYPLPYSVLVMDNAQIHAPEPLYALCAQKGVRLVFLPPYCPHLNPIEIAFGLTKKRLRSLYEDVDNGLLEEALIECTHKSVRGHVEALYRRCGYAYATEAQRQLGEVNMQRYLALLAAS